MAALLIKNLPESLHRRLKAEASRNRRSMAKEVLMLLDRGLSGQSPPPPAPFKGRFPLTDAWLSRAIRRGRS
jgi:plasmid stability protein